MVRPDPEKVKQGQLAVQAQIEKKGQDAAFISTGTVDQQNNALSSGAEKAESPPN